jgi:cytidylate kinase
LEYKERGQIAEPASIAAELAERDHRDRTRSEAPLIQAPDAQLVDTTHHTIDEVEEIILRLVRERTSNGKDFKRQGTST